MVYDPTQFSTTGGYDNSQIKAAQVAAKNAILSQAGSTYNPTQFSTTGGWDNVAATALATPIIEAITPVPLTPGGGISEGSGTTQTTTGTGSNSNSGTVTANSNPAIKIATPDLINAFSLGNLTATPVDAMADLIFEDIGGQDLLDVSRTDLINGQNIDYQPISNLGNISIKNNPIEILKMENPSAAYFGSFPIALEYYLPNIANGPNGENAYIIGNNIIIDLINMTSDKMVQVEFIAYQNIINDIIY